MRFAFYFFLLIFAEQLRAGDWPQILGPQRNGIADGETLVDAIPAAGLKKLWSAKIGSGYAGPIVVGNRVFVFHRVDGQERLEALDAATGKSLWKADFPALYRGGIDADKGPRCVPIAAGDAILAYGAAGDLVCVNAADGKPRWTRALFADFKGDEGYFGAGSSPLVIGNRVLVNVGGRGAGIVCLDLASGKSLWQKTDEQASYAAPTTITQQDRTQALFITRLNLVLADPETGATKTLLPFGARGPTVNAATPIVVGEHVFLTASYNIGAAWVKITDAGATPVWENDRSLSSQYATPVYRGGYFYGIHGREDAGGAQLRCIEAKTGDVQWSERDFGVAHVISAGDKLLILKVDGEVILAAADPKRFHALGGFSAARGATRALPALAGGRLFFRTTTPEGGELFAFEAAK